MGLFTRLFGKKSPATTPQAQQGTEPRTPAERSRSQEKVIVDTPAIKVTSSIYFNNEVPPLQGDYAKAVFLSVYGKASPIKAASAYQQYLLYECGIKDCPAYHKALIEEGLLAPSSMEDRLSALKMDTLKQMLSEKDLPVSGKKADLVARLLPVVDEPFLSQYVPELTYAITAQGQAFLDEHSAYVYLHKHKDFGIGWEEFDKHKRPGFSTRDTIWGILNERVAKREGSCCGRNEYLCMYRILVEEGRRANAIEMLLRIIYIDVSGVEGLTYLKDPFWSAKEAREGFGVAVMLAPALINSIADYKDIYRDEVVDRLFEWKLPIQICEKKLFLDLVHANLEGTFDEEKFLTKLKTAWNSAVKAARG